MLLYHGSNIMIKNPRIIISAKGLDFGSGFYLTSSYEQAERWARLKTNRFKTEESLMNLKFLRGDDV